MQFHVRTHDGGRFTFDVRTGEMLSAQPAESNFRFVWPTVAACAVAGVAVWFVWRRRSRAARL